MGEETEMLEARQGVARGKQGKGRLTAVTDREDKLAAANVLGAHKKAPRVLWPVRLNQAFWGGERKGKGGGERGEG